MRLGRLEFNVCKSNYRYQLIGFDISPGVDSRFWWFYVDVGIALFFNQFTIRFAIKRSESEIKRRIKEGT